MQHDADSLVRPLPTSHRRIAARLAAVVCPPELLTADLTSDLLAEFEAVLSVLPAGVRKPIRVGLVAFDRGAHLYPKSRGRRFARLDDATAKAYFRAVLGRAGLGTALARIKGIVVMCYYELPEVKEEIGYRPAAYIASVTRRRLASYGPQIRAGEAAVLTNEPAGQLAREPTSPRLDES